MSPVRQLKKLSSYYSIIWRNSTSSVTGRVFHEILRDSTRFYEIPPQSLKDDPNNKDDPDDKIPSQFLLYLSVKWLHRRRVRQRRSSSISQKTGSNGYGNYKPSWTNEFRHTLTLPRKHLKKVYFKNHPIQKSQISTRMQPYMHSSRRINRKRTRIADDTITRT